MTIEFRARMQTLLDADTERRFEEMEDEINQSLSIPKGTCLPAANSIVNASTVAANPALTPMTFERLKAMMDKLEGGGFQKGVLNTFPSVTSQPFKTVRPDMTYPMVSNAFPGPLPPNLSPYGRKISSIFDITVIESLNLPTHHVGHWFAEVPPSKNRSKRLWKKLRYGTRHKSKVRQMREETVMMLGPSDMLVSPAMAKQIAVLTQPVKEG